MHKELHFLFERELQMAYHFKIHFEYCCVKCSSKSFQKRVANFKSLWLGATEHYLKKWKSTWLDEYLGTIKGELTR